jgi:hypothetical protein
MLLAPVGLPAGQGEPAATRLLAQRPPLFIENQGQADLRVAYYLHSPKVSVYFTSTGLTYVIRQDEEMPEQPDKHLFEPPEPGRRSSFRVDVELVGARPVRPRAEEPTPTRISFFSGPRQQWRTGVATYRRLVYSEPWPGIDLVFFTTGKGVKHQLEVRPGADPEQIRMAIHGASAVRIDPSGGLLIETPVGDIWDERPIAYQGDPATSFQIEADERVDAEYQLLPQDQPGSPVQYRFKLGPYDRSRQLVIDPVTFLYSSFIGGSAYDSADALVLDDQGNLYITGVSGPAIDFPCVGPLGCSYSGGTYDVYVAKISADGSTIIWAGYIGGSDVEFNGGIDLDADNNVYINGRTRSSEATFPVTVGPDLTHNSPGSYDGFVAKVAADGSALVYCGYIGGDGVDEGDYLVVDDLGRAYVTGDVQSSQATFPAFGAYDSTYNGNGDIYIARVKADGSGLDWSTYFGGTGTEVPSGLELYGSDLILAGRTSSTQTSFPVAVGPDLTYNGDFWDGFVAKLDSECTTVQACGYIGGSGSDYVIGMAVADDGTIGVTGMTDSTETSFPVSVGPDLTQNGNLDGWVGRVAADLSSLVYLGFIGGSHNDNPHEIDFDMAGNAYVVGMTFSDEASFPVLEGPDLTWGTGWDGFVAQIKPDGSGFDYCGYLGGPGTDTAQDVKVDPYGNTFVIGSAASGPPGFSGPTTPAMPYTAGNDGFIVKLGFCGHSLALVTGEWRMLALPCHPGDTLENLLGDDGLGDYDIDWAVFERNEGTDSYEQLQLSDSMVVGSSYWIKVLSADPAIDVTGSPADHSGDFAIPLVPDSDPGRWNMVGHPFAFEVDWANVKVYDPGADQEYTMAEVAAGSFINNRTMFMWNGGSYQSYHPVSNPGTLQIFDGFWVRVKGASELRIPPSPPAAKSMVKSQTQGWWLQLTAGAGTLSDPGNRIGRLAGASDGHDEYDLEELEPFATPYLTLVLPHPEWATEEWSHTTDFRELRSGAGGSWSLEIRAEAAQQVTLSWLAGGSQAGDILARSRLVDEHKGVVLDAQQLQQGSCTIMMAEPTHRLTWQVNSLPWLETVADRRVLSGQPVTLSVSYGDEDTGDSHQAVVDWGDGSVDQCLVDNVAGLVSATHTYSVEAVNPVELCVEDQWGGRACEQLTLRAVTPDLFADGFESGDSSAWSAMTGTSSSR